jgi:hypothetical protein
MKAVCLDCNITFTVVTKRHSPTYCPSCKETMVDWDRDYIRLYGNVSIVGVK